MDDGDPTHEGIPSVVVVGHGAVGAVVAVVVVVDEVQQKPTLSGVSRTSVGLQASRILTEV